MIFALTAAVAAAGSLLVTVFANRRYSASKDFNTFRRILAGNIPFGAVTLVSLVAVSLLGNYFYLRAGSNYVQMYKELLLIYGIYLIAFIDYKEHLIPNKLLLALLVIRMGFFLYEAASAFEFMNIALLTPVLGGLLGGVIILVAMLISRKGVGMGDVKLFTMIGLFVGSTKILPTLFYTVLISALAGLFLIIFRKAKPKDAMPMAPFALVGLVLNMLISHAGRLI